MDEKEANDSSQSESHVLLRKITGAIVCGAGFSLFGWALVGGVAHTLEKLKFIGRKQTDLSVHLGTIISGVGGAVAGWREGLVHSKLPVDCEPRASSFEMKDQNTTVPCDQIRGL
jgi:H+/Cl- antiporter ClcA